MPPELESTRPLSAPYLARYDLSELEEASLAGENELTKFVPLLPRELRSFCDPGKDVLPTVMELFRQVLKTWPFPSEYGGLVLCSFGTFVYDIYRLYCAGKEEGLPIPDKPSLYSFDRKARVEILSAVIGFFVDTLNSISAPSDGPLPGHPVPPATLEHIRGHLFQADIDRSKSIEALSQCYSVLTGNSPYPKAWWQLVKFELKPMIAALSRVQERILAGAPLTVSEIQLLEYHRRVGRLVDEGLADTSDQPFTRPAVELPETLGLFFSEADDQLNARNYNDPGASGGPRGMGGFSGELSKVPPFRVAAYVLACVPAHLLLDARSKRSEEIKSDFVFSKSGTEWKVVYEGALRKLRSCLGLYYLWILVKHCNRSFTPEELVEKVGQLGQKVAEGTNARNQVGVAIQRAYGSLTKAGLVNLAKHFQESIDPYRGKGLRYVPATPISWST